MSPDLPAILLVGSAGVGKRSLADAISGSSGSATWLIDNKYYSAEVTLSVQRLSDAGSGPQKAEAVVIVFDASRQETLDEAYLWLATADFEAAEIRLLVANKADQLITTPLGALEDVAMEMPRPAWLAAAIQWATNNYFEYIEACASDATVDARLRLDGDVQGVERIAEALAAHTWSNLNPKHQPQRAGLANGSSSNTASSAPASASKPEQEEASQIISETLTAAHEQTQEAWTSFRNAPEALLSAASTAPSTDTVCSEANTWIGAAAALEPPLGLANGSTVPNGSEIMLTDDMEAAHLGIDDFDKLMAEMSSARQRLATLSDIERRHTAAALALRFASLLGGGSDMDGSDSEDGA